MRFPLALLSLSLGFSSVLVAATPPPDMIDAIESAKAINRKRTPQEAVQKRGDANLEKKWVVLPSSALPGHLVSRQCFRAHEGVIAHNLFPLSEQRPAPHNSIFHHRPSVADDVEATAAPVKNRIKRVVQRRAPAPAANETVSAAPGENPISHAHNSFLADPIACDRTAAEETPAPAPAPSTNETAVASSSVNPLNPFDWPQAVSAEYNTTIDHFNKMDSLSVSHSHQA